jgi:hypothetical protein
MSTNYGVNVVVELWDNDDWGRVNRALEPLMDWWIGSGTGFGCRDIQLETADADEADELAKRALRLLNDAGLGPQIDTCDPYEYDDLTYCRHCGHVLVETDRGNWVHDEPVECTTPEPEDED